MVVQNFKVVPGDYSNIPKLLEKESEEYVLKFLNQDLYKAPYVEVTFSYDLIEKKVKVDEIVWKKPTCEWQENQLQYYRRIRPVCMEMIKGKWIIVRKGTVPKPGIFDEYWQAVQYYEPDDFVVCIGYEEIEKETFMIKEDFNSCQVLLNETFLPCKTPEERNSPSKEVFSARGFYHFYRWMVLPIELEGFYHAVTFLVDTGSSISSLNKETRIRLKLEDSEALDSSSGPTWRFFVVSPSRMKVNFLFSETLNNRSAHNVNILGADFLDAHILTDNKTEESLTLTSAKKKEIELHKYESIYAKIISTKIDIPELKLENSQSKPPLEV